MAGLHHDPLDLRKLLERFDPLEAQVVGLQWLNPLQRKDYPTEWQLLAELAREAGKVLTQRMLLQRVWGPEYADEAQYLRVYINQLRRKLEDDPANPRWIVTEPGVGYRLRIG